VLRRDLSAGFERRDPNPAWAVLDRAMRLRKPLDEVRENLRLPINL